MVKVWATCRFPRRGSREEDPVDRTMALVRCEPEEAELGDRAEFSRLSLLDSFTAVGRGERRAPNLLGIP
jgi:hypothetical protein